MSFIEGLNDDFATMICISLTIITLVFSWLSTNVTELILPANLFLIERSSRRIYTHNTSNFNRTSRRLAASSITTTSTSILNQAPQNDPNEIVNDIVVQELASNIHEGTSNVELQTESHLVNSENAHQESNSALSTQSLSDSNLETGNKSFVDNIDSASDLNEQASTINIVIRFVNEKEIKIKANPTDTILFLKRTHFGQELSNNKIVRFIYQGQFLADKNTVKSYNIKDDTTIHCHITSKLQPSRSDLHTPVVLIPSQPPNTSAATDNLRQRIHAHHISTIYRMTDFSSSTSTIQTTNEASDASMLPIEDDGVVSEMISNSQTSQTESVDEELNTNVPNTIVRIDLSYFLLPLFALLIIGLWYFRLNFKHLFSPLSTLILFIFTFVYSIFLVNNLNSPSIPTIRLYLNNRIWNRNRVHIFQNITSGNSAVN